MNANQLPLFTANLSRRQVEAGVPFEVGLNDWLISINDFDGATPNFANKWQEVLEVFFDDIEEEQEEAINVFQAFQIASFINRARHQQKNVWIHCTAGICRSGAVVEVLKLLGFTVAEDFRASERIPNSRVFSLVRWQFDDLRYSWE